MNYNPTDEEIDYICQSLMKFNDGIIAELDNIPNGNKKILLMKNL